MKIVLYIAASVDGYIAPADGAIEWLAPYETLDYGYDDFIADIDTVVMGRLTYQQSPYRIWFSAARPDAPLPCNPA